MIDQYFLVLTTIDLFVLTFMCILTKLSETLNSKQKRGFFLAFAHRRDLDPRGHHDPG